MNKCRTCKQPLTGHPKKMYCWTCAIDRNRRSARRRYHRKKTTESQGDELEYNGAQGPPSSIDVMHNGKLLKYVRLDPPQGDCMSQLIEVMPCIDDDALKCSEWKNEVFDIVRAELKRERGKAIEEVLIWGHRRIHEVAEKGGRDNQLETRFQQWNDMRREFLPDMEPIIYPDDLTPERDE